MSNFPDLHPWTMLYNNDDVIFRVQAGHTFTLSDEPEPPALRFQVVNLEAEGKPAASFTLTVQQWADLKAQVDAHVQQLVAKCQEEQEARVRKDRAGRSSPRETVNMAGHQPDS